MDPGESLITPIFSQRRRAPELREWTRDDLELETNHPRNASDLCALPRAEFEYLIQSVPQRE